ncbi:MAG: ABC transporter permease subunit [Deltaproteobacteria bacterium]|nr:ABC transporter permease subunit [Deltaproteobacteria bacterium]
MRHVGSVAGRELRGLFVSPVAYGVLSLFAILAGVFFVVTTVAFNDWIFRLQQFQAFDQLSQLNLNDHLIGQFYHSMAVVLLFLIPGITMGLFAAEKSNGTEELLLTSPLTIWDIVLGKFLAGAIFVALLVLLIGLYPGILFVYGDPELGKTLSGLLGVLLVGWTYVAIGVFASSVTRSQVVAFLLSFVLLLVLLILPAISELGVAGTSAARELLRYLSTDAHLEELVKGLVDSSDLAYFAVMIGSFLVLTKAAVESVRWR